MDEAKAFEKLRKKCPKCVELWARDNVKTMDDILYYCAHELDMFEEGQDGALIKTRKQAAAVRKFVALCESMGFKQTYV